MVEHLGNLFEKHGDTNCWAADKTIKKSNLVVLHTIQFHKKADAKT